MVNNSMVYTTNGMAAGTTVDKTYPVNYNDHVYTTGCRTARFIPYVEDLNSPFSLLYTTLTNQITSLQTQVLDLQAGISNKVLDTANEVDIEADSATATGYTVTNALGGRISGKGGNYLLAGTGYVTVNDVTTPYAYDNRGLPLSIGDAPSFNLDVTDGDNVKSNSMTELMFTPYIAG